MGGMVNPAMMARAMGGFRPPNMAQLPGGRGRPPAAGGVSVPRMAPAVPRPQAPTVAARPVGRPGSAAPRAGGPIQAWGPTGAAVNRLGSGPGAPMGATRGGAAPQRGFGGKLAQAVRGMAPRGTALPPTQAGGFGAKMRPMASQIARLVGQGARGPAAPPPGGPVGGGGGMAAGGPATLSAASDGGGRIQPFNPSPQITAGALGGWNANPQLIKNATNYLKGGAELAPQQRGSLDRLVRQTDQPMARMAVARPGGWRNL